MQRDIPYAKQSINDSDIERVIEVLNSDWLTQGPTIGQFERAVADYCGAKYAVAVNSATSALHIACLAANLGLGDKLWTTTNTFVASANCALYCGAEVDFIDIDFLTYNMSVEFFEHKLQEAKDTNKLPKVLIPVHFAGQSCDMVKISALASSYGITVIEDASHAIGGQYRGVAIGSCTFSDMTVFSFHPAKIITTGEGGMVLTNRKELYERLLRLRSHGISRNPAEMLGASHGPWYYQQIELGFNYRMTDIQAALGLSQIGRLKEFVQKRHFLAQRYDEGLHNLPIRTPVQSLETYSAFHLYVIRLKLEHLRKTHRQIFEELRAQGILINLHYIPVHTQPYYQKLGFKYGDYPIAEQYYREAISLPLYSSLSIKNQDRVIAALQEVVQ